MSSTQRSKTIGHGLIFSPLHVGLCYSVKHRCLHWELANFNHQTAKLTTSTVLCVGRDGRMTAPPIVEPMTQEDMQHSKFFNPH